MWKTRGCLVLGNKTYEEQLRQLVVQCGEEEAKGDLIALYSDLKAAARRVPASFLR